MKRNFSLSKFRIKEKKTNLNFIDAFNTGQENKKPKFNKIRYNSHQEKIKVIPCLKLDKSINNKKYTNAENLPIGLNNDCTQNKNKSVKFNNDKANNMVLNSNKKDNENNSTNLKQKMKIKLAIPINKSQLKPFQNLNQNYVININNNINNNYQIRMQNNNNELNKNNNKNNNYNFSKIKIVQSEDNKNSNSSIQKTVLTEISDLSCFKSNKKSNLNSITSFAENNDNDLFSEETNFANNIKNNLFDKQNLKNIIGKSNNNKKGKKIYINPDNFQQFCKEIEEKLNL